MSIVVAGRRAGLGPAIASARRRSGMSQGELAAALGLSLYEMDRIEHGLEESGIDLAAIAKATKEFDLLFWEQDVAAAELERAVEGDQPPAAGAVTGARATRDRHLVLGALTIVLVIRFFTEVVPVLPRAANFADVPVLGALVFLAALRPRRGASRSSGRFFVPVIAFVLLAVVSTLANLSRVQAAPDLLLVFGFLEPLGFYYAAYRLWPTGNVRSLSRLLITLGILQFCVVFTIDLPRFVSSGNPDEISGTFGENPYQLVFFLITFAALVSAIATLEPRRLVARFAPLLIGLSFVVIFLAQYRSLLVTTALAILVTGMMLSAARGRGLLVLALIGATFAIGLSYVAERFPLTRLQPALAAIAERPGYFLSTKLETFGDVLTLYGDNPRYVVTGTGPGTYSSRAWETFSGTGLNSKANVAGGYVSSLTGGKAYRTDVSDKYVMPRYQYGATVFGSKAASSPLSSYTSLPAELGLGGLLLIGLIYARALGGAARMAFAAMRGRDPDDPLPAILVATTIAFFVLLQMAVLDNWLEVARVTVPAWVLLAIGTKEWTARRERAGAE